MDTSAKQEVLASHLKSIGQGAAAGEFELDWLSGQLKMILSQRKVVNPDPLAYPGPMPEPEWWKKVREFVDSIHTLTFLPTNQSWPSHWRVYANRNQAHMALEGDDTNPPIIYSHRGALRLAENASRQAAVDAYLKVLDDPRAALDLARDAAWSMWHLICQATGDTQNDLEWHNRHNCVTDRWPIWQVGYGCYLSSSGLRAVYNLR